MTPYVVDRDNRQGPKKELYTAHSVISEPFLAQNKTA